MYSHLAVLTSMFLCVHFVFWVSVSIGVSLRLAGGSLVEQLHSGKPLSEIAKILKFCGSRNFRMGSDLF